MLSMEIPFYVASWLLLSVIGIECEHFKLNQLGQGHSPGPKGTSFLTALKQDKNILSNLDKIFLSKIFPFASGHVPTC